MGITIIPNQPIMFRNTDEIISNDCECNEQPFCQIVNEVDHTQFQIRGSNKVLNPAFTDELDPWYNIEPMTLRVEVTNVSAEGECDGEGSPYLTAGGSTPPYVYYLNGVLQVGPPSFDDLCVGCYYATVSDSVGNQASAEFCIAVNIICADYSLTTDFIDVNTIQLANCYTTDFI